MDKFHKRVTKRRYDESCLTYAPDTLSLRTHDSIANILSSKLELLEQELKNIKEVVNPRTGTTETSWTPPSPRQQLPNLSETSNASGRPLASAIPQAPTPSSEPPSVVAPSAQIAERRPKAGPTQSRMLEDRVVPGEDIDWYFNK